MQTIVIKHGNRIKKVVCKECGCEFLINIATRRVSDTDVVDKDGRLVHDYSFKRDHDVQYNLWCPECMADFRVHRKDLKNVEG